MLSALLMPPAFSAAFSANPRWKVDGFAAEADFLGITDDSFIFLQFADLQMKRRILLHFAHLLHILAPPHNVAFPLHIAFPTAFPAASAADWLSGSRWRTHRRLLRSKSSVRDWLSGSG